MQQEATAAKGGGAARRKGMGHLEVVRLLDLSGGRVDADPEDVVVGALLHHGGRLPGSRRRQFRGYRHRRTISAKQGNGEQSANQSEEGGGSVPGSSGPSRKFRGNWGTGIGSPDLGRFSREAKSQVGCGCGRDRRPA